MDMITVGFSRAKEWYKIGSVIIKEAEKRDYSHAYLKYTCPITGEIMVAQASHGYVNEVNYKEFLKHNVVVEEIDFKTDDKQFISIMKFIKERQGIKYSTLQVLAISVKKLFHIKLDYNNGDNQYICSEFIIKALQILNPLLGKDWDLDYVTPSDLKKILGY